MTDKEKAIELFEQMLSKNPNKQEGISMIDTIQAKLCALVAAQEMYNIASLNDNVKQMNYLSDVEQEIKKL